MATTFALQLFVQNPDKALRRELIFFANPSGIVTPSHFLIESANTPIPGAAVVKAFAPAPLNVKFIIALAKEPKFCPNLSGMVMPFHFFIDSASPAKGSTAAAIFLTPIPENVFSTPPRATSASAPPIAASPCLISSQDISENDLNAVARSPNPWTAVHIVAAPSIPAKCVKYPRTPDTTPISSKAPPIAASPLPISSQDNSANDLKLVDRSSNP